MDTFYRQLPKFALLFFVTFMLFSACQKPMFNPKSAEYSPIIELQTTKGNLQIQLYASTPKHRDNFVELVKEGYYNGLLFHRVIANFMVQGGDPDSKEAKPGESLGMGGPGYQIDAELGVNADSTLNHIHLKGRIAAARQGGIGNPLKKSSGSQFYIVQGQKVEEDFLQKVENIRKFKYSEAQKKAYLEKGGTPHLDADYTVFGELVDGEEVLDAISNLPCDQMDRPKQDVRIIKAVIVKG